VDQFQSTVDELSQTVQKNTSKAMEGIEGLRALLATDYGKLSQMGGLIADNGDPLGANSINSNTFNDQLMLAATQNYYGLLMEQRWTAYTLEDPKEKLTYTGPGKKTCTHCDGITCKEVKPWKDVPLTARFNMIWGYDNSGQPIQQLWFWGRGYDSSSNKGTVPPADDGSNPLTRLMFEPLTVEDTAIALPQPLFWWQKNAARRFHCDGSKPHDSRTTGKK
jgi:hypothetical protein